VHSNWRDWVGVYAHTANALLIAGVVVYGLTHVDGEHLSGASMSGQASNLLWFAILCGLGAAATIEVLKRILGFRGMYQLRQTRQLARGTRARSEKAHYSAFPELLNRIEQRAEQVPKSEGMRLNRR
jgi:hypothetical protein